MNLCRLLIQCGIEACVNKNRETPSTMGGRFSTEIPFSDSLNYPEQTSVSNPSKERRKSKMSGLATLKRKLLRRRRTTKMCDHGRVLREFVSMWTWSEVRVLLDEYEALATLKDLTVQAELARPPAATYKQDLSKLYDFKYCTDVDLIFSGACFPVHRALLAARCHYFRELLAAYPAYDAQIRVDLQVPGLDVEMFSALLRYLYTGDVGPRDGDINLALLRRLGDELGVANQLEADLRFLLDTGDYADTVLVFSSEGSAAPQIDVKRSSNSEFGFRPKLELGCHKAILSARSPFFRNLIQRRNKSGEERTERVLHIQSRIMLDDSVIPKRYSKVLLHAIYLDTVDLSLILRGSGCSSTAGSLGEVESLTVGRTRPTPLEEMMELYQIGRFLELDIVSQGCEDLILEWLTLESLPNVLRWGSQPHGSPWVYRQAKQFLCEEFSQLVNSPILLRFDKEHLIDCLKSDFLQASELEVLQAAINWSEHKATIHRSEEKDLSQPSGSRLRIATVGRMRREASVSEVRDQLAEVLPYVRLNYVLPSYCEPLQQAIRRGLLTEPSWLDSTARQASTWSCQNSSFVRPRLFTPYYDEIKTIVDEQMMHSADLLRVRRIYIPDIANTTFIDNKIRLDYSSQFNLDDIYMMVSPSVLVPDKPIIQAMLKRELKLKSAPSCQRALCLSRSSVSEINHQIRLRVVREFNLPDSVAELLEKISDPPSMKKNFGSLEILNTTSVSGSQINLIDDEDEDEEYSTTSSGHNTIVYPRASCHKHDGLPAVVPEGNGYTLELNATPTRYGERPSVGTCLSEVMPDVAAIANVNMSARQIRVSASDWQRPLRDMPLDLGDGANDWREMPINYYPRRRFY